MRALPVVPAGVDDVNIHSAVQSMQSLSLVLGDVDVSALSESVTSTVKDLIPADVDVNAGVCAEVGVEVLVAKKLSPKSPPVLCA